LDSLLNRCPENDLIEESLYRSLQKEGKQLRFLLSTYYSIISNCDHAEAMRDKRPLPRFLPAMMICGDLAPKVGFQESSQRLRNIWFPAASLRHIEDSKVFLLLEGEAQVVAVATLLDDFVAQCLHSLST